MGKRNFIIVMLIGLVAGAAAGGAVAYFLDDDEDEGVTATVTAPVDTGAGTSTGEVACPADVRLCPDGSSVGRTAPDCEFAPCPELPPVVQSENIKVYAPQQGALISSPVTISGEARVFEGTVNYRVLDGNGAVIGEGFTTAASTEMGQFGPYSVAAGFDPSATPLGKIEVFDYSARDGSVENLVTVVVQFQPAG